MWDDIWSFDNIKKFALASFYKRKKNKNKFFYSFKEIFIRSGYHKSLLFVLNMYFYDPVFQLLPDSSI